MALGIFVITYLVLSGIKVPGLELGRPGAALAGACAMVAVGAVLPRDVAQAVDVDTLILLLGMMIISAYLTKAAFFRLCAHHVLRVAKSPRGLLLALISVSAVLSAFLVNDTVCLMLTPLVLALADGAELEPTPYLLALCMSANAGSAATFTGNPQNMLIGAVSGQSYGHFAAYLALPSLIATAAVAVVLLVAFRKALAHRPIAPTGPVPATNRRLLAVCMLVLAGVVTLFFLGYSLAWSALGGAAVLMVLAGEDPREELEQVDYLLLVFFAALFLVVHGLRAEGWPERMYQAFAPWLRGSELPAFTTLTLVGSNLFSNVPFVMLARHWVPNLSDPSMGWQVLALASTLAGNLTLVGSVANLIVFEGARGRVTMGFWGYFKVGLPATVLSLALGTLTLWAEHRYF